MIPRKLILRAIVDCLDGQIARLRDKISAVANPRIAESPDAASKIAGRKERIAVLRRAAAQLTTEIGAPSWSRGPDVRWYLGMMLIAAAYLHGSARAEIRDATDGAVDMPIEDIAGLVRAVFAWVDRSAT